MKKTSKKREEMLQTELAKKRAKLMWLGLGAVLFFVGVQISRRYVDEHLLSVISLAIMAGFIIAVLALSPYMLVAALGPIFLMMVAMIAVMVAGFGVLFGVPSLADWMSSNDTGSVVVFLGLLCVSVVVGMFVLGKWSGPMTAWANRKLEESIARSIDTKLKQ